MFEPLTGPRSCLVLSPNSTMTLWIAVPLPDAGVTDAVNDTSVPAVGFVVLVVIETTGWGLALTETDVPPTDEFPNASKAVTRIANVPLELYV